MQLVLMVSGMGPINMALWTFLYVTTHQTYFLHHVTEKSVYVFADVPKSYILPVGNYFKQK